MGSVWTANITLALIKIIAKLTPKTEALSFHDNTQDGLNDTHAKEKVRNNDTRLADARWVTSKATPVAAHLEIGNSIVAHVLVG
jgi:hypothetical protein